jgi:uncharacterized membrane protein YdjX (TVP38/TMEM64 family)
MTQNPTKRSAGLVFWWIVSLIPLIGILFSLINPAAFFQTQERYRELIKSFGAFGPIAFVALQALQVIVTPINHYAVGIAGGFLFGPYLGGLLNWIGRMIGHLTAFWISRSLARPLALRFVDEKTISKYDKLVADKYFTLFLIYFLPFFPDDEISYLAGLSRMNFLPFLLVNLLGQVGGSWSLAYVGGGVSKYDWFFWLLVILTAVGFPVIWMLLRRQAKTHEST